MEELIVRAFEHGSNVVLALVIFYFYRQDRKDSVEAYLRLATRFDELGGEFKSIVKDNTEALTVLSTAIKNGRP